MCDLHTDGLKGQQLSQIQGTVSRSRETAQASQRLLFLWEGFRLSVYVPQQVVQVQVDLASDDSPHWHLASPVDLGKALDELINDDMFARLSVGDVVDLRCELP